MHRTQARSVGWTGQGARPVRSRQQYHSRYVRTRVVLTKHKAALAILQISQDSGRVNRIVPTRFRSHSHVSINYLYSADVRSQFRIADSLVRVNPHENNVVQRISRRYRSYKYSIKRDNISKCRTQLAPAGRLQRCFELFRLFHICKPVFRK